MALEIQSSQAVNFPTSGFQLRRCFSTAGGLFSKNLEAAEIGSLRIFDAAVGILG